MKLFGKKERKEKKFAKLWRTDGKNKQNAHANNGENYIKKYVNKRKAMKLL